MRRGRIGEFALIQRLRHTTKVPRAFQTSVLAGIGDDAAVLKARPGLLVLATTDLLAEHVHFDLRHTTYRQLGFKAAMANFSDIAAMGGLPRFVLIALALPRRSSPKDVDALYAGLRAACRRSGAAIIGGDTSTSSSGLFISLAVLGEAHPSEVLRRSTAHTGDHLYVTGTLGDAQAGLEVLQSHPRERSLLTRRHLMPAARLEEGRLLAQRRLASAAIDLSDGLAGDLRHLCEESGVGCVVDARSLPMSPALRAHARRRRRDPLTYALSGGEDYELLFAVPPTKVRHLKSLIARRRLRATAIGRITPARRGLRLIGLDGVARPLTARGYEHRLG